MNAEYSKFIGEIVLGCQVNFLKGGVKFPGNGQLIAQRTIKATQAGHGTKGQLKKIRTTKHYILYIHSLYFQIYPSIHGEYHREFN